MTLRASAGGFAAAFGVVSALDSMMALWRAHALGAHSFTTVGAILGLWLVVGGLTGVGVWIIARVALGELDPRLRRVGQVWLRWWARDDRRPTAALIAGFAGFATWAAGSWCAVWWLIEHKHGAGLIASAAVGSVVAVALGASIVAATVLRIAQRVPLPPFRVAVRVTLGLIAVGAVLGVWLGWRKLVSVGGVSIALYVLGVLLAPLAVRRAGERRAWVLPLVGVLLAPACARVDATRTDLVRSAYFARQVFVRALRYSDFDRDGVPWLLTGSDCAPFDPDIRPYAPGTPGNGVDEDCDGKDEEQPALALVAPRVEPVESPPSFLLITIDSLRADHLGVYGYKRPTSPVLDLWSRKATVFERAWSADSGTAPSLWSFMVGKTPFQVDLEMVPRFPPRFGPSERTLARHLADAGYNNEAVLCGRVLGKGHWNIRDGFARYRELCGKKRRKRQAPVVDRTARSRLKRLANRKKPFFLWVHFYDPHTPYHDHDDIDLAGDTDPPRIDRYDEEIRYTDEHLGKLLFSAASVARRRPLFVAVTADHGENFGEHGSAPHARNLYRQVTRVPLLMRGPGVRAQRVRAPVCINDLFPTFLELAGLTAPTSMRSLRPALDGKADVDRLVFQENSFAKPLLHTRAVVSAKHHLILDLTTDRTEMFDLEADWDERTNIAGTGLAEEVRLKAALAAHLRTSRLPPELAR